jgi:hypothetical protein
METTPRPAADCELRRNRRLIGITVRAVLDRPPVMNRAREIPGRTRGIEALGPARRRVVRA